MATEFDNNVHLAMFKGPGAYRTGNAFDVRWSEIVLASLRAAGFLDNMVDGTVPPTIDKLWLDKNLDPAVLKEWNPEGFNWEPVTSQTFFGRLPWRGSWQSSIIYRRADVVSYQGSIWVSSQPSQNRPPVEGAYWNLFIASLGDASVTTSKIAPKAVIPEKMADGIIPFSTRAEAANAIIRPDIRTIYVNGDTNRDDGKRAIFVDTPNGRPPSFASSGESARPWYRGKNPQADVRFGQVATRCGTPNSFISTNKQMMSRVRHFARDRITSLQVSYPNYSIASNVESATGAVRNVTASIEYQGQFFQFTWGGSAQVAIPDLSNSPLSDALPVDIPEGAEFFTRSWQDSTAGIVYSTNEVSQFGDRGAYGASGIADQTLGGDINNNSADAIYLPSALVAKTDNPSIFIVGDSREYGVLHDVANASSEVGFIPRAVSPMCGYINGSRGGERLSGFIASHAKRLELAQYCSHVAIHEGINDFLAGTDSSTAISRLQTIIGYFPNKEVWLVTVEPVTTSTDGWTTVANQTVDPVSNAARITFNDAIRDGIAGVAGYFDLADVMESSRNSGKWRAPGGIALSDDGTHETPAGYEWAEQSGVIDPRQFFYVPNLLRPATREEAREGKTNSAVVTPASLGPRPAFRVSKGGVDQIVTSGASAELSWSTALINDGKFFLLSLNRWFPPKGRYYLHGQIYVSAGLVDTAQSIVRIGKNGVTASEAIYRPSGTGGHTFEISMIVDCSGSDYFSLYANLGGTGDKTINGGANQTWFEGFAI